MHTFIRARKTIHDDRINTSYQSLQKHQVFDFIAPDDKRTTFIMRLRIVKVKLGDDYEYLITNLPEKKYAMSELKYLYNLRWGIMRISAYGR